jgi:hypothetical protein
VFPVPQLFLSFKDAPIFFLHGLEQNFFHAVQRSALAISVQQPLVSMIILNMSVA